MIRTRNVAFGDFLHPNTCSHPLLVGNLDVDALFASLAENNAGFAPGTVLTLLKNVVRGCPKSVCFTTSGGAGNPNSTFRITGQDQYGEPVTEDVIVTTATGNTFSLTAFKNVARIEVIAQGASTRNIQIGWNPTTGCRLGLPFHTADAPAAGAEPGMAFELVDFQDSNGLSLDVDSVDMRRGTLEIGAGGSTIMCNLIFNYRSLGQRV